MEQTLLTRNELAKRWGISLKSVINYEQDGIISRIPKIPVPRYSLNEILNIEQTDMSENSPLFVKQLKKENKQLKEENEKLNKKLNLIRQALI